MAMCAAPCAAPCRLLSRNQIATPPCARTAPPHPGTQSTFAARARARPAPQAAVTDGRRGRFGDAVSLEPLSDADAADAAAS
jgi:hypothetical protein